MTTVRENVLTLVDGAAHGRKIRTETARATGDQSAIGRATNVAVVLLSGEGEDPRDVLGERRERTALPLVQVNRLSARIRTHSRIRARDARGADPTPEINRGIVEPAPTDVSQLSCTASCRVTQIRSESPAECTGVLSVPDAAILHEDRFPRARFAYFSVKDIYL